MMSVELPTNINLADNVSQGLTVKVLLNKERWFRGPASLWENKTSRLTYPVSLANISDKDPEVRAQGQTNHVRQIEEKQPLYLMMLQHSLMVYVQESCCLASENWKILKGKEMLARFITLWQAVCRRIAIYRGSNHQVCAEITLLASG